MTECLLPPIAPVFPAGSCKDMISLESSAADGDSETDASMCLLSDLEAVLSKASTLTVRCRRSSSKEAVSLGCSVYGLVISLFLD